MILVCLLPFIAVCATSVRGGPEIKCDEPTYNFGTVTDVVSIAHTFILRNIGDSNLVVNRVKAGCGCTTTSLSNTNIPPQGSVNIASRLSLKGIRGSTRKSIHVHSSDPQQSAYRLDITGVVRHTIDLSPNKVVFRRVKGSPQPPKTVRVTFNTDGLPVHVTGIETNNVPLCQFSVTPVVEGKEYKVNVTLDSETVTEKGTLRGTAVVLTDHPGKPRVDLPIMIYQPKEISIIPRKLVIVPPVAEGAKPRLLVRSVYSRNFKILGVDVPENEITVATTELRQGTYQVELSLLVPPQQIHGKKMTIRVELSDGTKQSHVVPIEVKPKS